MQNRELGIWAETWTCVADGWNLFFLVRRSLYQLDHVRMWVAPRSCLTVHCIVLERDSRTVLFS